MCTFIDKFSQNFDEDRTIPIGSRLTSDDLLHFRFNTYVMNETAAHYSVVSDIVKKAWPAQSSDVSISASNYTLYTIQYTIYTLHYTLYTIHYTLHTAQYTMYILHYTLYTINYTLYTIHYTPYTVHYTIYTTQYTHNIHYTLYTIHYTLYTIHYTLYTIHYTFYTIHYTLYILHYTHYTTNYKLQIVPVILYTNAGLLLYNLKGWLEVEENSQSFTENERLVASLEAGNRLTVGPERRSSAYRERSAFFLSRNIVIQTGLYFCTS